MTEMATSGGGSTTTGAGAQKRFAAVSLWVGIALIAISIYFFLASVTLSLRPLRLWSPPSSQR